MRNFLLDSHEWFDPYGLATSSLVCEHCAGQWQWVKQMVLHPPAWVCDRSISFLNPGSSTSSANRTRT